MDFKLPVVPDDFDDGLREPSHLEMAATERELMLQEYEGLLADLLLYYTVGHLAEWEYRTQPGGDSSEFDGIADSHPLAEAGLRLQAACSELYEGLRGTEAAVGLTEGIDPEQFAKLLQEGDLTQTDRTIIDSRNELDAAWASFTGLAEDQVESWLDEASRRIAEID